MPAVEHRSNVEKASLADYAGQDILGRRQNADFGVPRLYVMAGAASERSSSSIRTLRFPGSDQARCADPRAISLGTVQSNHTSLRELADAEDGAHHRDDQASD